MKLIDGVSAGTGRRQLRRLPAARGGTSGRTTRPETGEEEEEEEEREGGK